MEDREEDLKIKKSREKSEDQWENQQMKKIRRSRRSGDQEGDMKFKQIKETGKMFTSAPSVVMATTSLLISMEKISKWFVT